MGRVYKDFTAQFRRRVISTCGQIDSGADITVFSIEDACRLGYDLRKQRKWEQVAGIGGSVAGPRVRVRIRIGSRAATVQAFVPVVRVKARGRTVPYSAPTLIGADFMQASRAKLDYARQHGRVFSGVETSPLTVTTPTPAPAWVARQGRRTVRCP